MNTVDCLDLNDKEFKDKVVELSLSLHENPNRYDNRMVVSLLGKWDMEIEVK
jgi:hypothetical protein